MKMGKKKVKTEVEEDTFLRSLITAEIKEVASENSIELNDNELARTVEATLDLIEVPILLLLENVTADVLDRAVNGELPESDDDEGDEDDEGDDEGDEDEGDDDGEGEEGDLEDAA